MSAEIDDTGGQRKIPGAIAWYDGMPLYPHHFLEAELRSERLLAYHSALLSPFHWGVRSLDIDAGRLRVGEVCVNEIDAIMPDGLAVWHSSSDPTAGDEPLRLQLTPPAGGAPIKVYLAVRRGRVNDAQQLAAGGPSGDQGARYRRQSGVSAAGQRPGVPTFSSATPEDEAVDPPRLRPRLTLAVQRPGAEHVSLPIAELDYEPGRGFFTTNYVPPVPRLGAGGPARLLLRQIEGLVQRIRRRAEQLLRQADQSSATSEGQRVAELRHKARALAVCWPMLDVALRSGAPDPYSLYMALATAVGHAAGAVDEVLLGLLTGGIPAYQHEEIRASFEMMSDVFKVVLERTAQQRFEPYQLTYDPQKRRYLIRGGDLPAEWHARQLVLEARCSQSTAPRECLAWMDDARIASESRLDSLAGRRLTGLGRKLQSAVADELYESPGVLLFELASEGRGAFVIPGEALVVLHPQELDLERPTPTRPEELWLHVERKETKQARPEGPAAYRIAR